MVYGLFFVITTLSNGNITYFDSVLTQYHHITGFKTKALKLNVPDTSVPGFSVQVS